MCGEEIVIPISLVSTNNEWMTTTMLFCLPRETFFALNFMWNQMIDVKVVL